MIRFPRRAFLLCACVTLAGAQGPLEKTLDLMNRVSSTFKGLTADVVKTHFTFAIKDTEVEQGAIAVRKPKPREFQVLWTVMEPAAGQTEFSGHTLRAYNPKTNIIQEYSVDRKYGDVVNEYLLLGFGTSPAELRQAYNFGASRPEAVNGRAATKIELTPKKPDTDLGLVRADLWISDETGIAIQQRLNFVSGDWLTVTYSNTKIRSDIPDSAVKLNAPANARKEKAN